VSVLDAIYGGIIRYIISNIVLMTYCK